MILLVFLEIKNSLNENLKNIKISERKNRHRVKNPQRKVREEIRKIKKIEL